MKKFLTIVTIAIAFIYLTSYGNKNSKATTDNETEVYDTIVVEQN